MDFRTIKLKEKIINKDFVNKRKNSSPEDDKRQKNIISKLNLKNYHSIYLLIKFVSLI